MRTPAKQLTILFCAECGRKATDCYCRVTGGEQVKVSKGGDWQKVPVWTVEQFAEALEAVDLTRGQRADVLRALTKPARSGRRAQLHRPTGGRRVA
jgi:hypothetical protein